MVTQEAYVSLDVAKTIRAYGFVGQCSKFREETTTTIGGEWNSSSTVTIGIPTQQMVLRWLREVCTIYIDVKTITPEAEEPYFFIYLRQINSDGHQFRDYALQNKYPSYDEAVEASLRWVLEHWFSVQP